MFLLKLAFILEWIISAGFAVQEQEAGADGIISTHYLCGLHFSKRAP